jgi:hypothetical protein
MGDVESGTQLFPEPELELNASGAHVQAGQVIRDSIKEDIIAYV